MKNLASCNIRSRITGSALKLNLQGKNFKSFEIKTLEAFFGANFDLLNTNGCVFWLSVFHAKVDYYLLQQLLKIKNLLFN